MVAKKSVAKKPVAKKTATKKPVKKIAKKRVAQHKATPMKSFHLYKDDKPFIRAAITRQTVYWIILLVVIIITQLWILRIQMNIASLTSLVTAQ
jgi:hypothetical protein